MKYIVMLDVEVEDENSEEEVRRAIEGVASQAQSGWFGLGKQLFAIRMM
jgi:hypothetical protein